MREFDRLRPTLPTGLWIDGAQTDPIDGARFPVVNPATGEVLAEVADASGKDALRALDSACRVQQEWAATPPRQRSIILRTAWVLVLDRAADLAMLMTLEMGKALPESKSEVVYGAEFLRWFSEEAVRIQGRYTNSPTGAGRILVTKVPVGPCLAITPWNFPLAMGTRKIASALAAGCTMIVKPAEDTPLTMLLLAEIFADADYPRACSRCCPPPTPRPSQRRCLPIRA